MPREVYPRRKRPAKSNFSSRTRKCLFHILNQASLFSTRCFVNHPGSPPKVLMPCSFWVTNAFATAITHLKTSPATPSGTASDGVGQFWRPLRAKAFVTHPRSALAACTGHDTGRRVTNCLRSNSVWVASSCPDKIWTARQAAALFGCPITSLPGATTISSQVRCILATAEVRSLPTPWPLVYLQITRP